jgi:hypothetical protein
MLRNAISAFDALCLRRGALLIRGPFAWWVPALRCIVEGTLHRVRDMSRTYLPIHFGGRFSENASGPSI